MSVKKFSILAVDDEPDVNILYEQSIFRHAIRNGEINFFFALNGEEALNVLRMQPEINIMLVDINMPVMDGLTLLAHIHAQSLIDQPFQFVKVIMVTAYGDLPNIKKALNAGAFDFLTKPINKEDVDATIAKALAELDKTRAWHNRFLVEQQRRITAERKLNEITSVLTGSFIHTGGLNYGA